jgi:4-diphosphocytidyl-2-C-methyl-D-erythritol kinase
MRLEKASPCTVNLLLNILGKRSDGFHELESVFYPVKIFDQLSFETGGSGIQLDCGAADLPTDSRNLVYRAAAAFQSATGITDGLRISLNKHVPLAAGLGGGSANAAVTLLGLNEMFGKPLSADLLSEIAASLGSDVPFFLQTNPALATGRGERIQSLDFPPALTGACFLLVHPGFGVPTAWAYQNLARFPGDQNGRPGRAKELAETLRGGSIEDVGRQFYNSLEAPVFEKYPLLAIMREFFVEQGAVGALMSGSGSTVFALVRNEESALSLVDRFKTEFGPEYWLAIARG